MWLRDNVFVATVYNTEVKDALDAGTITAGALVLDETESGFPPLLIGDRLAE